MLFLLACHTPDESSAPPTDTGDDTGTPVDYSEAIDAVERAVRADLRGSYASGASVAVWKEGRIVYAAGFGTKADSSEEEVLPTTLFQIGSDTKKITAIALLQQVEAGRLTVDETLGEAIPGLSFATNPALTDDLTLHELLSHQSGLYDYTPWIDEPADEDLEARALGRFAESEYSPGTSGLYWNYCNPNFSLAGLAVEKADGRAWGDVVEQDVFAPLGMTRTFARQADALADGDYAVGYGVVFPGGSDTFDPFETADYTLGEDTAPADGAFIRPAGLVWSTASDMARLGAFLVDGNPEVLSDDLRGDITTPHVAMYPAMEPTVIGYGYGMMLNGIGWTGVSGFHEGVRLWLHGGNTLGMTSTFYVLPDQRVVVSILSNGYGDDFSTSAVTALEAFADGLPEPAAETPTVLGEPGTGEELAGTWYDPNLLGTLTLTWDGSALQVSAPDLEANGVSVGDTLEPAYADYYLLKLNRVDYDFSWYRGEDGSEYLVNRQMAWKRADENAVRARPARSASGLSVPLEPDLREQALGLKR